MRGRTGLRIGVALSLVASFAVMDVSGMNPVVSDYAIASSTCESSTPTLQNGSFENLPNVASFSNPVYGGWHGYAGGPPQVLLLNQNQPDQRIQGWKTTAADQYLEIQRQLPGYAQDGTFRSGSYFDTHNAQPADGQYFAEINANYMAAFYQDIEAQVGQTYYWSIKHRGRQFAANTTDAMLVRIGPPAALVQQTGVKRFRPTNNPYTGSPVYGNADTESVSVFRTALEDGWVKYQGAYVPSLSETIRFQFEAASGGSVGNFIDDIQFTVFKACAAEVAVTAGTEAAIDVTSAAISLGDDQELVGARVLGGVEGQVIVEGNSIRFEGEQNGDVDVEYTVGMNFAGSTLTQTGVITFRVSGGVDAPAAAPVDKTPVRYRGPEFFGPAHFGVLPGSTLRVEGKNFDTIQKLYLGETEVDFRLTGEQQLAIKIPTDFAPGVYNLRANAGRHGNAYFEKFVGIRAMPQAFSKLTAGSQKLQGVALLSQVVSARKKDSMLNKVQCVVNSNSLERSRINAAKLCSMVAKAAKGVRQFEIVTKSTVTTNRVFARVSYGYAPDSSDLAVWLDLR